MEQAHALEIVESILKDSKVFQGILVARNCLPVKGRTKNIAQFLHQIGDALVSGPHQGDLFTDAPKVPQTAESPSKVGELIECPACHEKQPDGGPNCFCQTCGVGPMPTNMPITVEMVMKALEAVKVEFDDEILEHFHNDETDADAISEWTIAELEQALTWTRDMLAKEENEDQPAMPAHVKFLMAEDDLTPTEISLLLIEHGIVIELATITEWGAHTQDRCAEFCLEKRRHSSIAVPPWLQEVIENGMNSQEDLGSEEKPSTEHVPFIYADGTMTVTVEDRLQVVKMDIFDAADCEAALAHDDKTNYLQKTVRLAIQAKLTRLKRDEAAAAADDHA